MFAPNLRILGPEKYFIFRYFAEVKERAFQSAGLENGKHKLWKA